MIFKKSAIAICVGSTLLTTSLAAQIQTDTKAVFSSEMKQASQITIQLKGQPALHNSNHERSDYRNEANSVSAQQQRLFQQILSIDPSAKLIGQTRLLSNLITVQLGTSDVVEQIKALSMVSSVFVSIDDSRASVAKKLTSVNNAVTAEGEDEAEEISLLAPYLNSETAGSGVSVAIISTGIDYTLPIFGGSGVYGDDGDPETPPVAGSYLDATENGAIGPTIPAVEDDPATEEDESAPAIEGYDEFPTNVVVGGWDFASENWGQDGNPIDQNLEYDNGRGWQYPTGLGTQLASIVHQLAPGAELYAYKVANVSESYGSVRGRSATRTQIVQAMEHALDPNQDGDTSDHVDIALLDAVGAAAFYQQHEQGGTSLFLDQQMIQKASALGMTVVTFAGEAGHISTFGEETLTNNRNWISWEGSAPAAITVGSAVIAADGETVVPAAWSPMGPVRGSKDLKPEVMSFAEDVPVALISNADATAATKGTRTSANAASARIAAAVAVIKSAHPELGPVELKALLANTANHNIKESDAETGEVLEQAELIYIGHGIENVAAAVSTPVAIWNSENNQPYVQFGAHEVANEKVIVKDITIRNFSNETQTYAVSYMANGDKAAQAALTINHPTSVSIPANQAVIFAVNLTIDANMLPAWPLTSSEEYTDANLKATELNGYFQFRAEGQPELNVGWMVQARPSSNMDKHATTVEYPISLGWNAELGRSEFTHLTWANNLYPDNATGSPTYQGFTTSFTNESTTATTYEAYPVIISKDAEPEGKEGTYGHKIKTVGGGIYDDARCEITGKKLAVAVNLWQPADNAMANHLDKIGTPLFFYDLFPEQTVLDFGMDESYTGAPSKWDLPNGEADMLGQTWVEIDENGQPATYYIDLSMTFDYSDPTGRYKKSKLPVRMALNGTNVVSEICVEELAHHDISDAVDDPSLPTMVPELDAAGNQIAEMVSCTGATLEQVISWGGTAENSWYGYCASSTGLWDAEGYALDESGNRIISMVENTERGVPGENELLNFFDQNFGFSIATDRDTQNEKFASIAQFNLTKHGYHQADIEVCFLNGWGQMICAIQDVDYTQHIGFAKTDEENPAETADYSHVITVEANEQVTVAAARLGVFGGYEGEVMIISSDDNFAMTSPVSYNDADSDVIASVRSGQEFSIAENAEMNSVVGTIKLDTVGLFAIASDTQWTTYELSIVNALPGSPFAINQQTHELYVVNPAALDFEQNSKFEVLVQAQISQDMSATTAITVWINDLNDVAPEVVAPIAPVTAIITNSDDASVSIDLSAMFADAEGDSVTLTVSGLPAGLSYANGMISGTTDVAGTHTITVTASDGINQTSSSFEIVVEDQTTTPVVEPEEKKSSGGSFGGFLLAFAGLSLFRRRK